MAHPVLLYKPDVLILCEFMMLFVEYVDTSTMF